ncbi:unnamed protein product [Alopecurus aequalis]
MKITVILLLPLASLLLVLASGRGLHSCTSQIIPPLGKSCDRAGCHFQSRIAYTKIPCNHDNVPGTCSWTGECVSEGCEFTFCITMPPAPASVLDSGIVELDHSTQVIN